MEGARPKTHTDGSDTHHHERAGSINEISMEIAYIPGLHLQPPDQVKARKLSTEATLSSSHQSTEKLISGFATGFTARSSVMEI